jgi:hypothetical protein
LRDGIEAILELDPRKFPAEGKSICSWRTAAGFPARVLSGTPLAARSCPKDPAERIDILVAYTQAACAAANSGVPCMAASDHDAVIGKIYQAVGETNQIHLNSLSPLRLSLASVQALGLFDESSLDDDLRRLLLTDQASADAQGLQLNASLLALHDLRVQYAADAIVVITKPRNQYPNCDGTDLDLDCPACGVSPAMTPGGPIPAGRAFAVVPLDCATGVFSFAHELGHVMGANHDPTTSPEDVAFPYSHGYVQPTPSSGTAWRTVMAYNTPSCVTSSNPGGCVRLPYWSNVTTVLPNGDVIGSSTKENNLQALKATAETVANYEASSVCGGDVWMRDTWQDRGAEPDPAQSNLPMWKSPYIWVRNDQDPDGGTRHQHEHQNPEFGQKNWVYVKVHNGGHATVGNLELRVASASTGLFWPASWQLLATKPIALSANSTQILEFEWDNLPATGHYCFIARWLSVDDPMVTPESAAIEANVRGNNNIIWRNVNVVDLASTPTVSAAILISNPTDSPMDAEIDIRLPRKNQSPFLKFGRIAVALDGQLREVWDKGGRDHRGFKVGEKWSEIADGDRATLGKLLLPAGFSGTLSLEFARPETGTFPRDVFDVDVLQMRVIGEKREVVGGVTYEVTTIGKR